MKVFITLKEVSVAFAMIQGIVLRVPNETAQTARYLAEAGLAIPDSK
jgi:hypothetical protein